MTYHTETEVEAKVELKRRSQEDEFEEIVHAVITDAFSKDFAEMEFDFEVDGDMGIVELEIYDSSSYKKSDHYEVASGLLQSIHEAGFKIAEMHHDTARIKQEEESDDSEDEE